MEQQNNDTVGVSALFLSRRNKFLVIGGADGSITVPTFTASSDTAPMDLLCQV